MSDEAIIETVVRQYLDVGNTYPYETHIYTRSSVFSSPSSLDIPESAGGESWYWKQVEKDAEIIV